jgi:transposase
VPLIPFKVNTQPDRGSDLWSKMFFYYNYKREEFLAHYHKRSNVESVFQMIKSKFGERLRSKTTTAQVNEALCKVLCHNLCVVIQSMYELNITPKFISEAA